MAQKGRAQAFTGHLFQTGLREELNLYVENDRTCIPLLKAGGGKKVLRVNTEIKPLKA